MSDEKRKILDMLASGKINVEQAEKLLNAIGDADVDSRRDRHRPSSDFDDDSGRRYSKGTGQSDEPEFLRIMVNSPGKDGGAPELVNIRIPLAILKAGMKLGSVIPESARVKISQKLGEKGFDIDFNNLKGNALGEMLTAMKEMKIMVIGSDGEQVKISSE
jgi:hypothetical protein